MFWSLNTAHTANRRQSGVISALDGLVAFATLESYGVVDGRDEASCDLASARLLRARKRATARAACGKLELPSPTSRDRRTASLTGKR